MFARFRWSVHDDGVRPLGRPLDAWLGPQWGPPAWTLVKNTILILCIVLPLFACVAYLTLWERKLIGWMQIRLGPTAWSARAAAAIADAISSCSRS